jgi:hypothetical protein
LNKNQNAGGFGRAAAKVVTEGDEMRDQPNVNILGARWRGHSWS